MTYSNEQLAAVLDCPMQDNDANAKTVRGYVVRLAENAWKEGEEFSGKRPFGNSGWEWEVFEALVRAGLIYGVLDEDGDIDDLDDATGSALVAAAIRSMAE